MIVRITSRTRDRGAAKATIRYITHRYERQKERITRALFNEDPTDKNTAYRMIDEAPLGTTFHRFTISPDRKTEDAGQDLDLRKLTQATMRALQAQFPGQDVSYFAAIHGHTKNRHVNLLVLLKGKISKPQLKVLMQTAAKNAADQRLLLDQDTPKLEPPLARSEPVQERGTIFSAFAQPRPTPTFMRPTRPLSVPSCPLCGTPMESHASTLECDECGLFLSKGRGKGLERLEGRGLSLSLEEVGPS
jgi:hypothetical protein